MIHTHGESMEILPFPPNWRCRGVNFPMSAAHLFFLFFFFFLFTNHLLFVTDHSHLIIPITDVVIISNEQ